MYPDAAKEAKESELERRIAELEARNQALLLERDAYCDRIRVLESVVAGKEAAADIFLRAGGNAEEGAVWFLRDGVSGNFFFASPEYETLWRGSVSALYADSALFMHMVHSDDVETVRNAFRDKGEYRTDDSVFRMALPESDTELTAVLHRYYGAGGEFMDMIVAARTSHWRQVSMNRFSTFFSVLFDNIPDALALVDADCSVLAANKSAAVRYGLSTSGYTFGDGLLKMSRAALGRVSSALQQAQQRHCSVLFREIRQGRHYECSVFPVPGGQPVTPVFGLLERDVTEREDARRKLVQSHKDLEDMVKLRTEALQTEIQERKRVEERLLREQEFSRLLVQSTPNQISVFDAKGQLKFANKAWCDFYGLTMDIWRSEESGCTLCGYFGDMEREALKRGVRIESEERIIGAGGRREWFDVIRTPIKMPDGEELLLTLGINITTRVEATRAMEAVRKTLELRVKERTGALGRVNDQLEREIAERKLNEELIIRHKNHLEALMNALAGGALLLDTEGRIITMNTTAAKLLDTDQATGCDSVFFDFLASSSDLNIWQDALDEVLQTMMPSHFATQAFAMDLDVTYYPVKGAAGGGTGVAVYIVNVTSQKEASRRMRRLSAQVLSAQEEERKRIGRELHDSTAQTLSGIKFMMEGERSRMELAKLDWPIDQFGKIIGHLQGAIVETRRIIMDLRPTVLDDLGLLAALRWLQQEMGEMHSLTITSHLAMAETDLSESQKSVLFRVAQEALNNVARHSGSSAARISLEQVENECVLTVTDNGSGFDHAAAYRAGIGLDSMRERLELVCGRLEIVSEPDIGTVVRAIVPFGPDC